VLNNVVFDDKAFREFVVQINIIAAQFPIPSKPKNEQLVAMFLMLIS